MRKFLFFIFSSAAFAQGTFVNFLPLLVKCPSPAPAFLMWTGTTISCITLGQGITISNGVLNVQQISIQPTAQPKFETENIPLASVAIGATTITYTTVKTPISGFVAIWYNSQIIGNQFSQPFPFNGQPLTISLPPTWSQTDNITILYQSQ